MLVSNQEENKNAFLFTKSILNNNILAYIFLLTIISCTSQIIDIELPPYEPQLAVTAILGNNRPDLVYVNRSTSIEQEVEFSTVVNDAKIRFWQDNEAVLDDFVFVENAYFYPSPINYEEEGDNFFLTVSASGFPSISTIAPVLQSPMIIDGSLDRAIKLDVKSTLYYDTKIQFTDPPEENFYHAQVFIVKKHDLNEYYPIWTWTDQLLFTQESRIDDGVFFSDISFNGQKMELRLKAEAQYINFEEDHVAIKLSHISKDHYLFLESFAAYERAKEDPFAEPVIVHSNIENGHGIFAIEASEMYIVD